MALRGFFHRLLVISVFAGIVAAQTPSAPISTSTADPWILPAGTVIRLHNLSGLDSTLAKAGDPISFEVTEPVESRGLVIIPKHAIATGRIVKSEHSRWGARSGHLAIDIDQVQTITGALIKIRPFVEPVKKADQKTSVGDVVGGVVGGILLLPIIVAAAPSALVAPGPEKWIPPGSDFSAQTIDPVQLDFSAFNEWQREDPFAADYAEVVIYRPIENGSKDRKNWDVECSGDRVATIGEKQFARFFLPSGDYWLKASGKTRTISIEKKESPKSRSVHMEPNSQYVFRFATLGRSIYGGPSGYVSDPGVDIGENLFLDMEAASVVEFKPRGTTDESKSIACGWKEGEPFSAQRANGFAVIDGTPIELQLTQDWSSETAKLGDKVSFALVNDVEVRHAPIFKAGDIVEAVVSIPDFVRPEKYKGQYDLVVPNLTLPDGRQVNVRTAKWPQRLYLRNNGAPIVSGSRGNFFGSPYVIKKHAVLQLAKGTVVTIYVEDNYLLDPARIVQKAPIANLKNDPMNPGK
jgi:hypothetical protein